MTALIDKQKLHDALRQMGKKNLKPVFREFWTPECPPTGYCYVVAEVVYHYLERQKEADRMLSGLRELIPTGS